MAKQVPQCLVCVALAEKRVNSEPHSALKKTGDLDISQGHERALRLRSMRNEVEPVHQERTRRCQVALLGNTGLAMRVSSRRSV